MELDDALRMEHIKDFRELSLSLGFLQSNELPNLKISKILVDKPNSIERLISSSVSLRSFGSSQNASRARKLQFVYDEIHAQGAYGLSVG